MRRRCSSVLRGYGLRSGERAALGRGRDPGYDRGMSDPGPKHYGPENCKDCSRCGRPAVVTEVTVEGGQKVERKLCAECAAAEGSSVQSNQPLEQIMTSILLSQQQKQEENEQKAAEAQEKSPDPAKPANRCSSCGLSFNEFRTKGLLGCADC